MFEKRNKQTKNTPANELKSPIPKEPVVAPKPRPAPQSKATVIGENISVEGTILGRENLIIDGTMKGNIELEKHKVTIGHHGQVEATIHAENVTVSGRLAGNILATGKVEFTKQADFNGEIKAKRIAVEDGAYLKAIIELERENQKPQAPPRRGQRSESEPIVLSNEAVAKG